MKAITIWQPYATLIMLGLKQYETRSWGTSYRGPLIIHAAKKWDEDREFDCQRVTSLMNLLEITPEHFTEEQRKHFYEPLGNTLGRALGVVELVDCQPMADGGDDFENEVGSFGDGRFGWKCGTPRLFEKPIAALGKQGLWVAEKSLQQAAKSLIEGLRS